MRKGLRLEGPQTWSEGCVLPVLADLPNKPSIIRVDNQALLMAQSFMCACVRGPVWGCFFVCVCASQLALFVGIGLSVFYGGGFCVLFCAGG